MKLTYYGHSCFSMTFADGTVLVTDPFDAHITYPPCEAKCNFALVSHGHGDHSYTQSLRGNFEVISTEGTHKTGSITVSALHSWHDHHEGSHRGNNLMFKIEADGLRIAHLGDLGCMPDEAQSEFLKKLDVLLIPVGGNYTIDYAEAAKITRMLDPRVTVAMHYRTAANNNFRADTHEPFTQEMSAVRMPKTIEINSDSIRSMPKCIFMDYE